MSLQRKQWTFLLGVADFGISALLQSKSERRMTFTGTPYWMAPEVIISKDLRHPYDFRVDIWSLGITCLELAEMNPPLHEMLPLKALFEIPNRPPPQLRRPNKWYSCS